MSGLPFGGVKEAGLKSIYAINVPITHIDFCPGSYVTITTDRKKRKDYERKIDGEQLWHVLAHTTASKKGEVQE